MNAWLLAACLLLTGGVTPCVWTACRGAPSQRLVGLSLAAVTGSTVLLLVAQGLDRTAYVDPALILAVLAPAGTLVFTRFVGGEDHLPAPGADDAGPDGRTGES